MSCIPFDLAGKVAIFTGSGRGICSAIAKTSAKAGANAALCLASVGSGNVNGSGIVVDEWSAHL